MKRLGLLSACELFYVFKEELGFKIECAQTCAR
jgi:hypothetical protein